jgi:ankyrin repeat protein
MTALIMAAENGNTDVVSVLLDKGADIEAKDKVHTCLYIVIDICTHINMHAHLCNI